METFCRHVYENINKPTCPYCGAQTRETDWAFQTQLHKEWITSGKAISQGWWSI